MTDFFIIKPPFSNFSRHGFYHNCPLRGNGACVPFSVLSSAWLEQACAGARGAPALPGGAVVYLFPFSVRLESEQACAGAHLRICLAREGRRLPFKSAKKKAGCPTKTNANIRFPNNPKKGGASFRARSPPTKSRNPTKQMRISAFPNNPKKGGTSFRARSPRKSNNPTKQCERQIDFYCFFAENELL
ncbi:hypothetical protein [Treponema saccharophilum]|uniref:hypothetical protein n=1 Tax=Treponema saccharophilum TaxID=165 RepID=UPI003867D23B